MQTAHGVPRRYGTRPLRSGMRLKPTPRADLSRCYPRFIVDRILDLVALCAWDTGARNTIFYDQVFLATGTLGLRLRHPVVTMNPLLGACSRQLRSSERFLNVFQSLGV